jgi:hypothetical protein
MQGRRVADGGFSYLEKIGDYSVCWDDSEIACLCFVDPNGQWGRIAAKGHGDADARAGAGEPEWTITQNEEGEVTVEPSIDGGPGSYHGYLTEGVWS